MQAQFKMTLNRFVPFLFFCVVLIFWEAVTRAQWIEAYLLPSPSAILKVTHDESTLLFRALGQTFQNSMLGLVCSVILGTVFGFLFARVTILRRIFYPYAILFQTVPVIAVAPLLVIWFGYGNTSVIVSSFIVSLFPMLAASIEAFRAVPTELQDLFRIFRSSRYDQFKKLDFPYALPTLFTGLRISAGLAIIGAIVGEFLSGQGLGSVIDVAKTQYRSDLVFAAIALATLFGVFMFFIVEILIQFFIGHWHSSRK